MASSQWNISRSTLFIVLLLGGFVLLLLGQPYTQFLHEGFHRLLGLLSIDRLVGTSTITMPSDDQESVSQEQYRKLYATYKNTYADLLEMQRRYSALQRIRSGLPTPGPPLILAQVINTFVSAEEQGLLVSPVSGTDELTVGQYVIGQDCVIGTISAVYRTTARVRFVTDAKHRLLVAIGRDGRKEYTQAQMHGTGTTIGRIVNLSQKEYDVRPGDTVYAASQGALLGTEVLIGEVTQVKPDRDHPLLWDITVQPVWQPDTLAEVGIVVMNPRQEVLDK